MSGYAPVFGSVFTGTLHGRWPDTGLWLCLIAMADKNGVLDVTPQYISSTTGLPLQDVIDCMGRFCEPDPYSRTPDCDGRRLVLLEPPRLWGWRIVNHAKYREKARLQAKDSARTASGADAERKRQGRGGSPDVPRSPPDSPAVPLSDADTDSDTSEETRARATDAPDAPEGLARIRAAYPRRAGRQPYWITVAKHLAEAISEHGATWDELEAGARRYAAYVRGTGKEGTETTMKAETFFGSPELLWRQTWEIPKPSVTAPRGAPAPAPKTAEQIEAERRLAAQAEASRKRYVNGAPVAVGDVARAITHGGNQ